MTYSNNLRIDATLVANEFLDKYMPGANGDYVKVYLYLLRKGRKGAENLTAEVVLSAVGIKSNIEDMGLEEAGVVIERDKVKVDEHYATAVEGVYAIGDIIATPALAHVASAEAIRCVEHICGMETEPLDYGAVPSCIFTSPEVASVGMTEQQARAAGVDYKVGRFPFTASGKAILGFQSDQVIREYIKRVSFQKLTPASLGDAGELLRLLDQVKREGYACDNEESELGLTCFAVPIVDATGRAVASISISGPTTRMETHKKSHIVLLKHTVDELSRTLR